LQLCPPRGANLDEPAEMLAFSFGGKGFRAALQISLGVKPISLVIEYKEVGVFHLDEIIFTFTL